MSKISTKKNVNKSHKALPSRTMWEKMESPSWFLAIIVPKISSFLQPCKWLNLNSIICYWKRQYIASNNFAIHCKYIGCLKYRSSWCLISDRSSFRTHSTLYTKGYSLSKLWSSAVKCCAQKLYVFHFSRMISFLPAHWRI